MIKDLEDLQESVINCIKTHCNKGFDKTEAVITITGMIQANLAAVFKMNSRSKKDFLGYLIHLGEMSWSSVREVENDK